MTRDPFAPTSPAVIAWPVWLAFAALVMAVGLVELGVDSARRLVTRARWIVGGALCDACGAVLPPMPTPQRLASSPPVGARDACGAGVAPESLSGDGALWRLLNAPDGRYAILSERQPGPRVGESGSLGDWLELSDPPEWLTFEDACQLAARHNGKQSTANMGPREAAERGGGT